MNNKTTNPIGRGTNNVSVNMPQALHRQLGREATIRGFKSKSEFIRHAILQLLKDTGAVCLAFFLWGAASLVCGAGVCGESNDLRRAQGRPAQSIRSAMRGARREGQL